MAITEPLVCCEKITELYREYRFAVFHLAVRLTNDRELANDVVQDVFLKANKALRKKPIRNENPKGWLLTITRHHCFDVIKKAQREIQGVANQNIKTSTCFTDRICDRNSLFFVDKFIEKKFSPRESKIFSLRFYHHYSFAEIAEITGLSEAGVRRIIRKLHCRLKEKFPDALF